MSNGTNVVKRNGSVESLDLNKLHLMVEESCRDLSGVSASQVEMTSGIQFYDGISTGEVQEILIKSAADLIDLENPNYQFVAARLLLFSVRKSLYAGRWRHHRIRADACACRSCALLLCAARFRSTGSPRGVRSLRRPAFSAVP